jgi:hypothetical protein
MPFFSISSPSSGNATQLQGRTVAATAPATGAGLFWNGTAWAPGNGTTGPTGSPGVDGAKFYSGSGAPTGSFGASGDFWLDVSGGVLYGPKASGSWGVGIQLQSGPPGPTGPQSTTPGPTGPAGISNVTGPTGVGVTGATGSTGATGARGATLLAGDHAPLSAYGADGDWYIDTNAADFYGPKASGSWGSPKIDLLAITGPTGSAGAASTVTGPTGSTGPAGAESTVTGPTGAPSTEPGPTGSTGPTGEAGVSDYLLLSNVPTEFVPSAHASQHAYDGSDPISPSSIGAASSSHTHAASALTTGVLDPARLGTGTASSTTYLRGNSTFATLPAATTSTAGTVIVGSGLSVSSGTVSANLTSVNGATGAITLPAFYEFTRSSKPAAATGTNGSYTWAIPTGVRFVIIEAIGGGGGGGSGRRGAAGTVRGGGGGGAAAGRIRTGVYAVSQFETSTLTITVGAGGAGGAARTADNTDGANGSSGGVSAVQTSSSYFYISAGGGLLGSGGTTSGGSGGQSQAAGSQPVTEYSWGGAGGTGGASTPNAVGAGNSGWVAAGGGGGGGISAADSFGTGGGSGWSSRCEYLNTAYAVTPNSNAGTAGVGGWGGTNAMASAGQLIGVSGSGGNANTTGPAGNGGNGYGYGAAGGGGGASANGSNSGAGGNGSDGFVRVTCF